MLGSMSNVDANRWYGTERLCTAETRVTRRTVQYSTVVLTAAV